MNKKLMLQIANDTESSKIIRRSDGKRIKFDMDITISETNCGAAACAIGCHILLHPKSKMAKYYRRCGCFSSEILGIDRSDFQYLFGCYVKPNTRRSVAARIRNFVKNGGRTN